MALLRRSSPSQVIQGLPFYQVAGKLVTKTEKKRPEMEIQFWSEKWTGDDFYFIMKTQMKIHLKIHRQQIAASIRINNIQSIQISWIYQAVLEIWFFSFKLLNTSSFVHTELGGHWDQKHEGKAKKKVKKVCLCI